MRSSGGCSICIGVNTPEHSDDDTWIRGSEVGALLKALDLGSSSQYSIACMFVVAVNVLNLHSG